MLLGNILASITLSTSLGVKVFNSLYQVYLIEYEQVMLFCFQMFMFSINNLYWHIQDAHVRSHFKLVYTKNRSTTLLCDFPKSKNVTIFTIKACEIFRNQYYYRHTSWFPFDHLLSLFSFSLVVADSHILSAGCKPDSCTCEDELYPFILT